MAVVGEAKIIVRAITTEFKKDIRNMFDGIDSIGASQGKNLGEKFAQGFNKSGANNAVGRLTDGLRKMNPEAERAREVWQKLTKTGFTLGPTIAGLVASISALIGSLVSVVGAAGAAGGSLVVLGNVFAGFGLALLSAKIALGGVMEALGKMGKGGGSAADKTDQIRLAQERLAQVIEQNNEQLFQANQRITQAQLNLNDAFEAGREELQQLGFAAEEAALAQQGAALDLERAREELARVQDLPPNSRIRREAELAFAQAELQYRQALDANADIAAEQEKYAQVGVEGTQVVIDARRELAEAEADLARTIRDGLRSQIQAEEALRKAKEKSASGGVNPFEGLTKSQIDFVKRMYALKPLFERVQEWIAAAFLPLFGDAIENFTYNVLPMIGGNLALMGRELGKATVRASEFLSSADGMNLINTFFENSTRLIGPMADAFGLLVQIFIRLMNAAAPVAEEFVNWIKEGFESFNTYLKQIDGDGNGGGKLGQFFRDAGDAAAEFGDLFGEVFRLIGQIIGANLGEDSPGRSFVRWMTDGLRAANDLRDSLGGSGLKEYFAAVNENVKPMLQFLGDMGKILIDMGANPAVGEVFEILRQAEPSIRKIAMALLEAAPAMAELVVQVVRIFAAFTDTAQITAFLDTLTSIATVVAETVEQAWFQRLLEQIGPLLGQFLALQTALNVVKFGFNVLVGALIGVLGAVSAVLGPWNFLVRGFSNMPKVVTNLLGPIGKFVGFGVRMASVIVAVVAGVVDFAMKSEEFRKNFAGLFETVGQVLSAIGNLFNGDGPLAPLLGFFDMVWALFSGLVGTIVSFFNTVAQLIGKIVAAIINRFGGFNQAASDTFQWFQEAAANITAFFDMIVGGLNDFLDWVDAVLGLGTASEEAATATEGLDTATTNATSSVTTFGTASSTATGQVGGFADGVSMLKDSVISSIEASWNFDDAMKNLNTTLDDAKKKVLDNSKAGRENQQALIDGARAVEEKRQADIDAGLSAEQVAANYKQNYDALKQTAINAGFAKDKVDAYIKRILQAPALTTLEIKIKTDSAQQKLDEWKRKNGYTVQLAIKGVGSNIRAMGGLDDHIRGMSFASGGIAEGLYRSMARPLYKFAEPETGWEAFISGRKGSEERNRAIVREAAGRLGMNMGGVNITVNPSPGMDERALAGAVSQEITKLMRKGSMY